ncbi:Fc.00g035670.m01.CDS01 [Cosmosporella sp. VM-42]
MDKDNAPPSAGDGDTPQHLSRTLLPGPVAQAVSLATRSTCLAIKLGSAAGSFGLGAARVTTVSSLELARTLVEGVLSRAGRDTLSRSGSDLATMDAESVIERSLENLHHAMTQVVFWTTAGFHFTSTTVSMASEVSQIFLSSLDQVLGSTDSSRAIASIVTLIRREFRDPATGTGDKVGVMDLVLGLCALAYLQRRCWRSTAEETRRHAYEEVIWDVVVLSDGERIDVQGQDAQTIRRSQHGDSQPIMGNDHSIRARLSQGPLDHGIDEEEAVFRQLKDSIVNSLPPDTTVSISNSVSTTQTITVDVNGPEPISLPTPPGAEVVESRAPRSPRCIRSAQPYDDRAEPSYRVVYKLEKTRTGNTSFRSCEEQSQPAFIELLDSEPSNEALPQAVVEAKETPKAAARVKPPSPKSPTIGIPTATKPSTKKPLRGSPPVATRSVRRSSQNEDDSKPQMSKGSTRPPSSAAVRPPSSMSKQRPEREANQKKLRAPLDPTGSRNKPDLPRQGSTIARKVLPKRKTDSILPTKGTEKKGSFKQALREGSQSLSNIFKDSTTTDSKPQARWKDPGAKSPPISPGLPRLSIPSKQTPALRSSALRPPATENPALIPRSSSRSSYVSVHERRRDSIVSQTDTYSIHSPGGLRPPSPGFTWTEGHAESPVVTSFNEGATLRPITSTSTRGHRRITSHVPSMYSLASNDSQSSLVLSSYYQKSAYSAADALSILRREGAVDGVFPRAHVLQNITRYMRFSSASYGSNFMKMMGISKDVPILKVSDGTHSDVRHFLHHTESDTSSILLASFVDPQGGTDSSGSTGTGIPLVHYISLDHDAKAVVLACRGTLGFEDVLADMTCDYDILTWRGRPYKVHKGVHASARRLLYGGDGRVLVTLREALVEFPEYGIVLCGHSLGGAVTALLGVMLAEPNPNGTGFVTTAAAHHRPFANGAANGVPPAQPTLPSGRPIHVYAYGPPGTMSTSLRKLTRGLITSVVHGNDLVPYLSLGVLHDFQAVALAFKQDQHQAKVEIRQRLWQALQGGITDKWYHKAPRDPAEDEYEWGLSVLEALRASTTNQKLMPPGEVFAVESQRVLRRDAFLLQDEDHIGKPAQRIVLKYVRDVEARFKEVRFGASMLIDHSPAKYEEALDKLRLGVSE